MIERLTLPEAINLVRNTPEQTVFDWKRTFEPPRDDVAKGEFVKDVMAVANGCAFTRSEGYIVYGINPDAPDPVVGIDSSWDDNEAQQLVRSVLAPPPDFLYYEVDAGEGRRVGVVRVEAPRQPFYIVGRDIGKLREGQHMIRQGSVTRGVTFDDHRRLYLTVGYGWAEQVLQRHGVATQMLTAENERVRILREEQKTLIQQMYGMAGCRLLIGRDKGESLTSRGSTRGRLATSPSDRRGVAASRRAGRASVAVPTKGDKLQGIGIVGSCGG